MEDYSINANSARGRTRGLDLGENYTRVTIIFATAGILLLITASRFVLQGLISLVILYKKLKATFKNELPAEQGLLLDQTRSRRDVG